MLIDLVARGAKAVRRIAPTVPVLLALLPTVLVLAGARTAPAQATSHAGVAAQVSDGMAALAGNLAGDWSGLAAGAAGAACPGDCDGNGVVSIDEMIRGVIIASGGLAVASCPEFDVNGDGMVSVSELVGAVRRALEGCTGMGAVSVCGGPITSTPKLCNLHIEPSRVESGRTATISFGLSDLEGDIKTVCLGLGLVGGSGMQQCNPIDPFGMTVNLIVELPGIAINLQPGEYEMAVLVIDATEARSEIVTARFTVFRLRR